MTEPQQELLVPRGSVTPLLCEPVFDRPGATATWFRDGRAVGRVSANSNLVLDGRPLRLGDEGGPDQVPQVGFLILADVRVQDEAEYFCVRDGDGERGESRFIKVAFLEPFATDQSIRVQPEAPRKGGSVRLDCPSTPAYPEALVAWKKVSTSLGITFDLHRSFLQIPSVFTDKLLRF